MAKPFLSATIIPTDVTMPNSESSNSERQRMELIVSYLDGEISPEEGAQVEQQLASDEQFRQQLQSFDRAWVALDELPTAAVDDNFPRTTMELIVGTARQEIDQKTTALPVQRRKRGLATLLLVAAAACVGFVVVRATVENPNRRLVADSPVIYLVDIYSQFHELSFLRDLHSAIAAGQWEADFEAEELANRQQRYQQIVVPSDRDEWLQGLTPDEKVTLGAKSSRFFALSAEERQRMRELHQRIESATDATRLQETMFLYQRWLSKQPPSQQFELRELPPDQRVLKVAQLREQDRAAAALRLSNEELRILAESARRLMANHRERIGDSVANLTDREWARWEKASWNGKLHLLMQRHPGGPPAEDFMQELYGVIVESLPDDARQQFLALSRQDQFDRIRSWMRQATLQGSARVTDEQTDEQLEEFFAENEELDAQQREQLLAMPRDEMLQELRRLYRGGQPDPQWRGRGRQGPRGRYGPGPPGRGEDRFNRRPPPAGDDGFRDGRFDGRPPRPGEHRPGPRRGRRPPPAGTE